MRKAAVESQKGDAPINCGSEPWRFRALGQERESQKSLRWRPMRFSLTIDLFVLFILYLSHLLSHSFHFLTLKLVEYLCTPPKKGVASIDDTYLHTGYEPNAYNFKETYVESYTELLTSPPFLSKQGFPEDAEYDDAVLEGMLREAHRVHSHHSQREDLSVGLSSSSVSDRTGRPVGDRAGRPAEPSSQDAQIRTLLDKQKERILAECQAEINRHDFQAAMTEEVYENWVKLLNLNKKNFIALELKNFNDEINNFFMHSYCSKIWNYVKLIRKVSVKWKN